MDEPFHKSGFIIRSRLHHAPPVSFGTAGGAAMEVHLPKPLHGWREFVGEVGIIVLGVLIALGAEQIVDSVDMHLKVRRAEAAMRLELAEDDGPQAYGRVLIGACLDAQLARIHDGAGHVPADQLRQWVVAYNPPFRTWDSEAWKTVLGSDVGSHMGPERLIQWSSPYRILPAVTERNQRERELAIELHEVLPPDREPSAADLQALRRDAAQLRAINGGFFRASQLLLTRAQAVGAPVPEPIRREMLKEARAIYGDCVRVPDLGERPAAQSLRANLQSPPLRFGS
jgi:hypothetical protein